MPGILPLVSRRSAFREPRSRAPVLSLVSVLAESRFVQWLSGGPLGCPATAQREAEAATKPVSPGGEDVSPVRFDRPPDEGVMALPWLPGAAGQSHRRTEARV